MFYRRETECYVMIHNVHDRKQVLWKGMRLKKKSLLGLLGSINKN